MCAYNKINGTYACEHKYLLNDIARDEWGFEGLIMTDWGAMDDRVWALESGLDLEMPYTGSKNDQSIIEAVNYGELDEQVLDHAVSRLLEIVKKHYLNDKFGLDYDVTAHDQLARQAVCESAVLLKNDDKVLPVEKHESIAIIGEFAEKPRFQGAGSSKINPHRITCALETLDNEGISYEYARGYDLAKKDDPKLLIQQAVALAKGKDKVIIYAGLPDEYESEGFDRTTINLPDVQNDLIRKIVEVNPNVIVFLHNGSAVGMPWLDHVKGILLLGLGGQSVGAASVDLMFGKSNPSGKLSETYPILLEDNPSFLQFGERLQTEYRESIYVGYRYYEKASKQVLFPFGHGLSYTEFEYDDLRISKNSIWDNETLKVTFTIRNVGSVKGKEVIQLYVSPPESTLFKPKKELREFCKVTLEPGEEEELTIELGKSAFAYWNTNINDWHVESGIYHILVGSSSRDIRVQTSVEVRSTNEDTPIPDFRKTAPVYYNLSRGALKIPQDQFKQIYGKAFPSQPKEGKRPFTKNSTFFDAHDTLVGKFFINSFRKQLKKFLGQGDQDDPMMLMMESMILDFPLRAFGILGLSNEMVEGMLDLLNRKFFRGIKKMIKSSHPKEEG
jgi:beta-glucosidase